MRMAPLASGPMDAPSRSRTRDLWLYLAGVTVLAWAITICWLAMRAVMDVGGMCAEGGPYVVATPCPDGVPLLLALAFPAGFLGGGMMVRWGSRLGPAWASLVALAWPALFLSLGWNFLDHGLTAAGGLEAGWLIPGVLFLLMGGVPLVVGIQVLLRQRTGPRPPGRDHGTTRLAIDSTPPWDAGSPPRARPAPGRSPSTGAGPGPGRAGPSPSPASPRSEQDARAELARTLRAMASAATTMAADQTTVADALRDDPTATIAATDPPTGVPDLVSQLERLAALHRDGSLGELEYLQAKQAVIDAAARDHDA